MVSAVTFSLLLQALLLRFPLLNKALLIPLNSSLFLAFIWAIQKKGEAHVAARILSWLTLPTGIVTVLVVLVIGAAVSPVIRLTCEADGQIITEGSNSPVKCEQGRDIVLSRLWPLQRLSLFDGTLDGARVSRIAVPFVASDIRYPADFSVPTSIVVTLDLESFHAIGVETGDSEATCLAVRATYCIEIAGYPERSFRREGLILGAGRASQGQVDKLRQLQLPSGNPPIAVKPDQLVTSAVPITAIVRVLDQRGTNYRNCKPVTFTPKRGDENLWEIPVLRLCSQ